jgi:hypothetical protein
VSPQQAGLSTYGHSDDLTRRLAATFTGNGSQGW